MDDATFAKQLADAALLRGTFTLRSGRTSSYYLDKYLFSTKPQLLAELGARFAQRVNQMETNAACVADRLAGAELGGIPLVTVASMACDRPCVFVRNAKKDYGTAKQIEGKLEKDDRVIIVEDIATSGGQSVEAVRTLRAVGAQVLGVIVVIDRQEGARENITAEHVLFDSLVTKADLGISPD
ncbi:MAG: orotate phosphoribosyltransferase [Phycisphaeraceae bacterium]|nr:orotate phosphoribosyltransferase [Phycisphaerales bacterium]MCB9859469.1 orotate phosphoribosyltransferase [Phycisphaeraceae bacterium]